MCLQYRWDNLPPRRHARLPIKGVYQRDTWVSAKRFVSLRLRVLLLLLLLFSSAFQKNLRDMVTFVYSRFENSLGIVKTTKY